MPTPPKKKAPKPKSTRIPNPATAKAQLEKEVSTTGQHLFGGNIRAYNPDDLIARKGLNTYDKMRREDEQVKAGLLTRQYAAISTGWEFQAPDTDDENEKDVLAEQKRFAEFAFNEMEGTFEKNLMQILSAQWAGFCLHGDTLIHTPSGDVPIKDLVGKRPWVFSRVDGELKLARASRVWQTKKGADCVKVTYRWKSFGGWKQNSIVCTSNHPFRLLDGSYLEAGKLHPREHLTPFVQMIKHPGNGLPRVKIKTSTGLWKVRPGKLQNRAQWIIEQLTGQAVPKGYDVHHEDRNTLNDDPSNLKLTVGNEHKRYHAIDWQKNASEEEKQLRNKKVSESKSKTRDQISKKSTESNLRTWQDPEVRAKRIAGIRKAKENMSSATLERMRIAARDPERCRKISEAKKAYYQSRRMELDNHEVVSVEPWGKADVYDMTVPGTHNFATNNVFVHNSVSELIWRQVDGGEWDGAVALKALKTRAPYHIEFEIDTHGNLLPDGLIQHTQRLPVSKFVIYCYGQGLDNPYGESDLRAAYRGYWAKDTIMRFMTITLERYGEPIPVLSYAGTLGPKQRAELLEFLQNLATRKGLIIPNTILAEFHSPPPRTGETYVAAMNACDEQIRIGILMPGLLGLSGEQQNGSYARAVKEFDVFLWIIGQIRRELESLIQERVVKSLVDFNWEVKNGKYPLFKFKEITEEHRQRIYELWLAGLSSGALTKTPEDENKARTLIDFPEIPEEELKRIEEEKAAQAMSGLGGAASVNGNKPVLEDKTGSTVGPGGQKALSTVPGGDRGARPFTLSTTLAAQQALQDHLVDFKARRELEGAAAEPLSNLLRGAVSVGYLAVPGIDQLHQAMGLVPTMQTDPAAYEKARDRIFNTLPYADVNLVDLVFTQPNINVDKVREMTAAPEALKKPVQLIKQDAGYYLLNGHHRVAARARLGLTTVPATVLDVGKAYSFEDHKGRPGEVGGSLPKGEGVDESAFSDLDSATFSSMLNSQDKKWARAKVKVKGHLVNLQGSYFGTGVSLIVNEELRSGVVSDFTRPLIEDFDRKKLPLDRNVTAYRVLRASFSKSLKVGDVVVDKGFISTTADKKYAKQFNPEQTASAGWVGAKKPRTTIAAIEIPKGTSTVLYGEAGESEILLGPNTNLKVLSTAPLKLRVVAGGTKKFSYVSMDEGIEEYSFPDHAGRPGEVGGSLPRDVGEGDFENWPDRPNDPWNQTREEFYRTNLIVGDKDRPMFQEGLRLSELADDAELWVYHATDRETADKFLSEGIDTSDKPWNLARWRLESGSDEQIEFAPGRGLASGLTIGSTPQDVSGYGRVILAVRVKRGRLETSPEADELGYKRGGEALSVNDAQIKGKISRTDIIKIAENRYPQSGHRELVEAALKAGKKIPTEVLKDYPDLAKYSRNDFHGFSFPDHQGRPGEVGGSLPREGELEGLPSDKVAGKLHKGLTQNLSQDQLNRASKVFQAAYGGTSLSRYMDYQMRGGKLDGGKFMAFTPKAKAINLKRIKEEMVQLKMHDEEAFEIARRLALAEVFGVNDYDNIPQEVAVYRGHDLGEKLPAVVNVTVDLEVAQRYGISGVVTAYEIDKSKINFTLSNSVFAIEKELLVFDSSSLRKKSEASSSFAKGIEKVRGYTTGQPITFNDGNVGKFLRAGIGATAIVVRADGNTDYGARAEDFN